MKTARILSSALAGAAAAIAIRKTITNKYVSVADKEVLVRRSLSNLISTVRQNVPLIGKPFFYILSEDTLNLSLYNNPSGLRKHRVFKKVAFAGFAVIAGLLLLPMILDYKNEFDKNSIKDKIVIMGFNIIGAMLTASLLYFVGASSECKSRQEIRSTYLASQVIGFDEE
jgi:hypothetical protein